MDVFKLFTAHPESLGESYSEHLGTATSFGARMVIAGIACMLHGLLPFLFARTGSRAITDLNEQMIARKSGVAPAVALRADPMNS
jgi:Family of unknown function (DUF6356)